MRRFIVFAALAFVLLVTSVIFTGCGSKVPERIIGNWQCEELASDQMTETGSIAMDINEDGTFSLEDAGEYVKITGTMSGDDTGKLGILELECEGDMNPPSCWGSLGKNSRIRYKTSGDDTLKLGYTGIWLTFHPGE